MTPYACGMCASQITFNKSAKRAVISRQWSSLVVDVAWQRCMHSCTYALRSITLPVPAESSRYELATWEEIAMCLY